MDRDAIYLLAFIHDIVKITVRNETLRFDNKPDRKYQLLTELSKSSNYFKGLSSLEIPTILNNQEPKADCGKIIQLAERLSSNEKRNSKKNFHKDGEPLKSIFTEIYKDEAKVKKMNYELAKLSLENIFPKDNVKVKNQDFEGLMEKFIKELKDVENDEQLYHLMYKYTWAIPTLGHEGASDVSLFDHLKTTAAIALCIYDQYIENQFKIENIIDIENSQEEQFMLINGDISGIQDFIFDVKNSEDTKGAAKGLKGRSVYVGLLSNIIVNYLIDGLELKRANLLYNGGGNFFILAPISKKNKFISLREEILNNLLNAHNGDIYFAIDYVGVSPKDFKDFSVKWGKVKEKVQQLKYRKWKELDLQDNFLKVFRPGEGYKDRLRTISESFVELTDQIKRAKYLHMKRVDKINSEALKDWKDIFKTFGYEVSFEVAITDKERDTYFYKINDTEFLREKCDGFIFGAYNLPTDKRGYQLTFIDLASLKEKGDNKLGVLKLDIDNLGSIFGNGLAKENRSISRMTTLSRMLGLFFQGYINRLNEREFDNKIYVVFSGGDDTFLLGYWDDVFRFTKRFYEDFRKYVCENDKITFSAGLTVFRPKYPMVKIAEEMEELLDNAKKFKTIKEEKPRKNKICFLGEIFNWDEFSKIEELQTILVELIEKYGYGRAILNKVRKSTLGFKKILKDSTKGKVDNIRFWRLAYYLREIKSDYHNKKKKLDKPYADEIINLYREIVIHNLTNREKIGKIMIIPTAVKWAEIKTRKVKGDNNG